MKSNLGADVALEGFLLSVEGVGTCLFKLLSLLNFNITRNL